MVHEELDGLLAGHGLARARIRVRYLTPPDEGASSDRFLWGGRHTFAPGQRYRLERQDGWACYDVVITDVWGRSPPVVRYRTGP